VLKNTPLLVSLEIGPMNFLRRTSGFERSLVRTPYVSDRVRRLLGHWQWVQGAERDTALLQAVIKPYRIFSAPCWLIHKVPLLLPVFRLSHLVFGHYRSHTVTRENEGILVSIFTKSGRG
jgi:hypothetical protein